jgi:hypothetical protein
VPHLCGALALADDPCRPPLAHHVHTRTHAPPCVQTIMTNVLLVSPSSDGAATFLNYNETIHRIADRLNDLSVSMDYSTITAPLNQDLEVRCALVLVVV